MHPEYEVYDFDATPREYEAIYVFDGTLLVKVILYQRDAAAKIKGGKPAYRWQAAAIAWTPGQGDDDYVRLCHLRRDEMAVRDVVPHEADEDTWLTAARLDAEKLIERAQVFASVIVASGAKEGGKRRGVRA